MEILNIEIKSYAIIDGKKYYTKFNGSLYSIFQGNANVKTVKIHSDVDLSGVETIDFRGMSSLKKVDMSGCDLSSVIYMGQAFSGDTSLESVDMSNCKTTNSLATMEQMFKNCNSLTSVKLNNINLGHVNLLTDMFSGCYKLSDLQISNWNTENVQSMTGMFASCYSLETIDLSSFDTSALTSARGMFDMSGAVADGYESKLKTIYASEKFSLNEPNSTLGKWNDMFAGCTALKGESGTTFDSTKTNGAYAHIDGGTSNPGYFTAK